MSKKIESPVKRFPGTVTLPDSLTFTQLEQWGEAFSESGEGYATRGRIILPVIFSIVQSWDIPALQGVTPETFPSTPIKSVASLLSWLVTAIAQIINEDDDAPNE